jgi:deazaflavin-dependent oxidoreductase (nitroreductase family)
LERKEFTLKTIYEPEMQARLINWANAHRTSYIQSGGAKGHIMDMRFGGGYRYATMLLLRYVGRKSGKSIINAVGYFQYGPEVVIVASKGGADDHPQWYLNLQAGGPADIQIATQAFRTTRRAPEADEKEEVWKFAIKSNPIFKTYREQSKRDIPLILFTPLEEIPVFSE